MGLQLRPALAPALETSASAMDAPIEEAWASLARKLWLTGSAPRTAKPETVKADIWDPLEAEEFSSRALTTLENLQILERYIYTIFSKAFALTNRAQIFMAILYRRRLESPCPPHHYLCRRQVERPFAHMGYANY